ncbi:hypothetical protein CAPTEDRAFT_223116 [Capitella teleta]|uniref:Uncharacterized protein n=1 Tax=Capitella teleta TaxID=283909 RepID=R7T534_CAPTE|nr:hypothetical protein CAPTEDRAFT_223116 [Capitella teleta]|eukprot:ELT88066.1 hypothetical protein CAPTEDRAFT_223116 [Capitella teleta]
MSNATKLHQRNGAAGLALNGCVEAGYVSPAEPTHSATQQHANFLKQFYSDKAVYVEEEEEEEEDTPQEESLTTGQMTTRVQSIGGCVRLDNDDIKASEPCAPVAVSTGAVSLDVKNKAQPSATAPGARPKSSKVLKRKNTPAALPTVAPLKQQNKFTGIKGAFDEFAEEEEEEEEEEGGDEYTEEGASACSDERAQGAACQTHGD